MLELSMCPVSMSYPAIMSGEYTNTYIRTCQHANVYNLGVPPVPGMYSHEYNLSRARYTRLHTHLHVIGHTHFTHTLHMCMYTNTQDSVSADMCHKESTSVCLQHPTRVAARKGSLYLVHDHDNLCYLWVS